MAMTAVLDIVLHLENLRNVDLFHQGVYQVRVRVTNENKDVCAVPFAHFNALHTPKKKRGVAFQTAINGNTEAGLSPIPNDPSLPMSPRVTSPVSPGQSRLPGPSIEPETNAYRTRGFRIRYQNENCNLSEIVQFRHEFDCQNGLYKEPLFITMELMYFDLRTRLDSHAAIGGDSAKSSIVSNSDFKVVATQTYKFTKLPRGEHVYIPVTFDEWHFALLDMMVHSVLLEFKYRDTGLVDRPLSAPAPVSRRRTNSSIDKRRLSSRDNLRAACQPPKPDRSACTSVSSMVSGAEYLPESEPSGLPLAEFLFSRVHSGKNGMHLLDVADPTYRKYMDPLVYSYNSLRQVIKDTMLSCLNNDEHGEFKELIDIPSLEPPMTKTPTPDTEKDLRLESERMSAAAEFVNNNLDMQEPPQKPVVASNKRNSSEKSKEKKKEEFFDLSKAPSSSSGKGTDGGPAPVTPSSSASSSVSTSLTSSLNSLSPRTMARRISLAKNLPFSTRIDPDSKSITADLMMQELNHVSGQVFAVWRYYIAFVMVGGGDLMRFMKGRYEQRMMELFSESVFRETLSESESGKALDKDGQNQHAKAASKLRVTPHYRMSLETDILDCNNAWSPMNHPILFEQRYVPGDANDARSRRVNSMARRANLFSGMDVLTTSPRWMGGLSLNSDISDHVAYLTTPRTASAPMSNMQRQSKKTTKGKGTHLFVFVHGFQGNQYDLRLLKIHLSMMYPDAEFLLSSSNEAATMNNINDMGARLALEVAQHIQMNDDYWVLGRLTFVAHSLGSVITRACLTHPAMEPYLSHLYTFVSLSGPHAGYLFGGSALVGSAMRLLKSWKKSECLRQLLLHDHKDPRNTFLYRLSDSDGLENFENVLLLSSHQDRYVPFSSARIEARPSTTKATDGMEEVFREMVANIHTRLDRCHNVIRIDINFGIEKKNVDSAIGRAAHILFLENSIFTQLFTLMYRKYFD